MGRHEAPRAQPPARSHGGAHESATRGASTQRPLPRVALLTAGFAVLAAVVVVLALLWAGTAVSTALLVGGGLLLVLAVAGLVLHATGLIDALPDDAERA